ncbi:carboxymuconolactone decarboxylase family protein [Parasphingorhabdus sp.]|uniref:carboxymuconolactone decarboxylase family protein n=1 Tax=Parasphingorhabdus sp. TaxID=2709688 RepID=UPI00326466BA
MSAPAKPPALFLLWPEGRDAMIAVDRLCEAEGLSLRSLELVRLWCSVLNRCSFCITMHSALAEAAGVPPALLEYLTERRVPAALDDGDRALLGLASAMTKLDDNASLKAAQQAMALHFSERETALFSYAIAQINAWNRLALTSEAMAARD